MVTLASAFQSKVNGHPMKVWNEVDWKKIIKNLKSIQENHKILSFAVILVKLPFNLF